LLFKPQKIGFSGLSKNMWLIQFNVAPAANNLIATSQSADSGNWLAAILLIAEINFPLKFERIYGGMLIFTIN
jgi:hypothetical protein